MTRPRSRAASRAAGGRRDAVGPEVVLGEIQRGRLRAAYLLVGDDQLAIDRVISAVRANLGSEDTVHHFRAGESRGREIAETLRTLPLFGSHRLVIVREPARFAEAEQELIADAVRDMGPASHVVLVSGGRETGLAARAAAAVGVTVRCRTPFPDQLPPWVQAEARQLGMRMDADAAAVLIDLVGADRAVLAQEMEKLQLLFGDGARVTVPQVENVVGGVAPGSVFPLVDAVGRGDAGVVARRLAGALRFGEKPLGLLALFVGHLRRLWRVHELVRAGCGRDERATALRVWGARLSDLEGQAERFPDCALREALAMAADLDVAIKSGRGDPTLLVEGFLLHLARSAAERRSRHSDGRRAGR